MDVLNVYLLKISILHMSVCHTYCLTVVFFSISGTVFHVESFNVVFAYIFVPKIL